jgi:hypothetical protein
MKKVIIYKTRVNTGKMYWYDYKVTIEGKPTREYMTFTELDPFFDQERQDFVDLMQGLGIEVEIREEKNVRNINTCGNGR